MSSLISSNKLKISIVLALIIIAFILYWFRIPIWGKIIQLYQLFSDREQIRHFITSFGPSAPGVFIFIQILQVLFAPVPGEATGFMGGYLFGTFKGFIYSSVGLTVGSWLNFMIGRFLGERYVRKLLPSHQFKKFDSMIKRQGIFVLFILFVFPGFPKDYLCLFLGLSTLPLKIFILLTGIGRMPGTFALSIQGEFLHEKNYLLLAIVFGVCGILVILAYRYREEIYHWIERLEGK
jgi:uncharacterized membrane protein YdjX (TVP38/TMEM64 family)